MNRKKYVQFLFTFIVAITGGVVFQFLHLPIPWLLGSMTTVLIGARFSKIKLLWPSIFRDIGIIIVGYEIGLSFTNEAIIQVGNKLPSMLLMTVLIILFSAGTAFFISKLTAINYPTVLIGSIPGGLTQMIILAEEIKEIDLTTVTFLQVSRLMMIIFIVPVLIFSPIFGGQKELMVEAAIPEWEALFPTIIVFTFVSIVATFIGKKLKLPTPYLLGPIVGTALLNNFWLHGPSLPPSLLDLSQLLIGGHLGLLMKPERLPRKARIVPLALLSGMLLIAASLILSFLLMRQFNLTAATSFLSLAPGGMEQMAIMAHEINADLSIVPAYQLFRIFFIFFIVPPILKWLFKRSKKQING